MSENKKKDINDVCIVGDGFAGLNSARLLAKKGINCKLYSKGYGASQLWVGTFDFLDYDGKNLQDAYNNFLNDFPSHPYQNISYNEIETSFNDFFQEFPDLVSFVENGHYLNKSVLTLIGNLKPCIGIWNSICNDYKGFSSDTIVLLIDFQEFNNSAMNLVAKGLRNIYKSLFKVIRLSFSKLLTHWGVNINQTKHEKLSDFRIGNYFDTHYNNLNQFTDYLLTELQDSCPETERDKIQLILFPPILGIKKNKEILGSLENLLGIRCKELVAFSPSLMSNRLMGIFDSKLESLSVDRKKRLELIDLKKGKNKGNMIWELKFKNSKGLNEVIYSKYVILSTGSVFTTGLFENLDNLEKKFNDLNIHIPNKLSQNFEISFDNIGIESHLFVCGAASYLLCDNVNDELEVEYGTGLGLAISTSHKISNYISNKIKKG
ncbi:MAG: hypothetical protein GF383_01160 [Candidatus Lokiarchaeota archaeon]|nr:hypothetical protein [Candidatus Lokiarchaeota archaeon]MBD3337858.1 hypothetical protein [Candidatus Lokiarchaeota archaeon]